MKLGIFGGSFDPVHSEHVKLAKAAIEKFSLDKLFIIPSRVAPHKLFGSVASEKDREKMCILAFEKIDGAEVSDYEIKSEKTSYSYLTCRHFRAIFQKDEIFFFVGADMLEDFFTWKNPEEILKCVKLVACGRGEKIPKEMEEKFYSRFHCNFLYLDFVGERVSSTEIRVNLAFGKKPQGICDEVCAYIKERGLYTYPEISGALSLEKEERREHSFRVALLACSRAKSLKIPFQKALLAAALHDCGKNLDLSSPLLKDFHLEGDVPLPIVHQFTGAYLAEKVFHVEDEDILNAIRYHTSGRRGMSELEKLTNLADALEAHRSYERVDELRALFWCDLDLCLREYFKEEIKCLVGMGKPIYPLIFEAYDWICEVISQKK